MSELALKERAPPRKRDAAATRAGILEAAKGQFARLGYDRTGLRDIAAEAGVDAALINRYFGGKEGLFTASLCWWAYMRNSGRVRATFSAA